jgi:hypothetical protein
MVEAPSLALKSAKKRKISGSVQHESRRRVRDVFAALRKTCRRRWRELLDVSPGLAGGSRVGGSRRPSMRKAINMTLSMINSNWIAFGAVANPSPYQYGKTIIFLETATRTNRDEMIAAERANSAIA